MTRKNYSSGSKWEPIPATTMVEVSKLISPEILIEIEADAYVGTD